MGGVFTHWKQRPQNKCPGRRCCPEPLRAAFLLLILQQESPIHSPEETVYTQPNRGLHGPEISMTVKACTQNLGKVFSFPKRDLKMANSKEKYFSLANTCGNKNHSYNEMSFHTSSDQRQDTVRVGMLVVGSQVH